MIHNKITLITILVSGFLKRLIYYILKPLIIETFQNRLLILTEFFK